MTDKSVYDDMSIGFEFNTVEIVMDQETVQTIAEQAQWQGDPIVNGHGHLAPGLTIAHHAHMKFDSVPQVKATIWAKSEHEFINPLKLDQKITIRGGITEKFTKRGRKYMVAEYQTTDDSGKILMKSKETSVHIE